AQCRRCLSAEKAGRPAGAGGFGDAGAALRAAAEERGKRAELGRGEAESGKGAGGPAAGEQRKRRPGPAAPGAAVRGPVAVGGVFAWGQDRQVARREAERAARQSRAAAAVAANLREARERASEAWALFDFPDRMQAATDAALAAVGRAELSATHGELTDE